MKKAQLKILERLFSHEITGEYPLQKALVEDEMIRPVQYKIGLVTCQGWELTQRGHITYCESCK